MWATIFWIVVTVVVIGLIWYFLTQKKAPKATKIEEESKIPFSEIPKKAPPSETPPSETPPPGSPTV